MPDWTDPQKGSTDFAPCLFPLLDALGWHGNLFHLQEAFPHMAQALSREDLLEVMANLNFGSRFVTINLDHIDPRLLPCLFIPRQGAPMVMLKGDDNAYLVFDSATGEYREQKIETILGDAVFFAFIEPESGSLLTKQTNWFHRVIARFRDTGGKSLLITFFLNVLALTTPIFIMTIYDQILFLEKKVILFYLIVGIAIFILSDFGLRLIRAGLLSFVSARLGNVVGNEVFRRLLFMPPSYTESASISSQYARLKDFDTVQDFFSGPAMPAMLELPFVALLSLALTALSGFVALVPLGAILAFGIMALIMLKAVHGANESAGQNASKRQALVMEIMTKMRTIKSTGSTGLWLERFRELSAQSAVASYHSAQLISLIDTLSHAVIMASGVSTIALSVLGVLDGSMTMGALVACMFLVWRILAPLRSGFGVMMQLDKVGKSVGQINRLMTIELERRAESILSLTRRLQGRVIFNQVSLRYTQDANPALLGVDFEVAPGECLVVSGHNGAGKSTLLKLIMNIYQPQAGRIIIDNISLRQTDPITMRRSVGYAPQSPSFFYGTIAQNLKLANPLASEEEMLQACARAGVMKEIQAMPKGLDTRIGDHKIRLFPQSFWQKLNMARAIIKPVNLYLFDQTADHLDPEAYDDLAALVRELKMEATVILVTEDIRCCELADRILWLEKGRVRMNGPAGEVIPRLKGQSAEGGNA